MKRKIEEASKSEKEEVEAEGIRRRPGAESLAHSYNFCCMSVVGMLIHLLSKLTSCWTAMYSCKIACGLNESETGLNVKLARYWPSARIT